MTGCVFRAEPRVDVRDSSDPNPSLAFQLGSSSCSNTIVTVTDSGTFLNISGGYIAAFSIVGSPNPGFPGSTMVVSNGAVINAGGNVYMGGLGGTYGNGSVLQITGTGSKLIAPSNTIFIGGIPVVGWPNSSANQFLIADGGFVTASNMVIYSDNSADVGGFLFVTNGANSGTLAVGGTLTVSGTVIADIINWSGGGSFNSGTLMTGNANISTGSPFVIGDNTNSASYMMMGGHTHLKMTWSSRPILCSLDAARLLET